MERGRRRRRSKRLRLLLSGKGRRGEERLYSGMATGLYVPVVCGWTYV